MHWHFVNIFGDDFNSNCLQNFLISLFAPELVAAFLISFGALFHSLAQSMLTLSQAAFVQKMTDCQERESLILSQDY